MAARYVQIMAPTTWSAVVVDDAPEVRALVRLRLQLAGGFHTVGEGSNGLEAIELARLHRPDLVVLDVSMPLMDGLEALPKILEASPQTRVVVYSGLTEPGLDARVLGLGAAAFIEKTASPQDFGRQVLVVMGPPSADEAGGPGYVADEALRRSEERFRLLIEAVQDYAIFMLDLDGRVASWNAGAERIKGYRADEIIGQHFRVFYPPDKQAAGHPEHELRLALRDGHYEEEGWRIRQDGTRFWANVVITAIRGTDGEHLGFAKVTRDVSERRQMLQDRQDGASALAAANLDLEQANVQLAQAAADQSEFLAVTAHELRSPIAVVAGAVQTFAAHWNALTDDDRNNLFDAMTSSTTRMNRLLSDLLTASRLEAGAVGLRREPLQLGDLLATSVTSARSAHPDADIVVEEGPQLTVLGDAQRLPQAIDNLVVNAIRHGRPPVRISVTARTEVAEIRISDAGPGVAPDMQARLFQRFASDRGHGGTGLGLFIVRELARANGGDAWYEPSAGDAGGFFVLTVPKAPPAEG